MQNQTNDLRPMNFRQFLNVVAFVFQSLAVTVEVFLHRDFGARYLRLQTTAGALIIFVFGAFWPEEDPTPLLYFLIFYLLGCVAARLDILRRVRKGDRLHTRYTGQPWLLRYFPRRGEVWVKRNVEPFFVFAVGGLILSVSPSLGSYLMLASVGLLGSVCLTQQYEQVRAQDLQDAFIEQTQRAARFREMHDRWS